MRYLSSLLAVGALVALPGCGPKSSPKSTNAQPSTVQTAGDSSNAAAATNRDLALSWDARSAGTADSFNIYAQAGASGAEVPVQQIKASASGFDPAKPSALLHLSDSVFAPFLGTTVCLSVSAVVGGIESKPSNLSCLAL